MAAGITLLLWLALTAAALCNPLTERQSQYWNDTVIDEPYGFKVTKIKACSYTLAFYRDPGDSRYALTFEASYGGSSQTRNITPTGNVGDFQISPLQAPFRSPPPRPDLSAWQLNSACSLGSSGAEPTSFRVLFDLDEYQFTTRNDWQSDPIPPTQGAVPAVPKNAAAVRSGSRQVRVTWSTVPGAGGYYVKARGLAGSNGYGDFVYYTTATAVGGSSTSILVEGGRLDTVAVVAFGADRRLVSTFTNTRPVSVSG